MQWLRAGGYLGDTWGEGREGQGTLRCSFAFLARACKVACLDAALCLPCIFLRWKRGEPKKEFLSVLSRDFQ